MGTGSFPGLKCGRGVGLTPQPRLVSKVVEEGRAIPLLTQRDYVVYKKGENLPTFLRNLLKKFTIPNLFTKAASIVNNNMKNVTTTEIELARLHSTHAAHVECT
jgi:hypothetical protein